MNLKDFFDYVAEGDLVALIAPPKEVPGISRKHPQFRMGFIGKLVPLESCPDRNEYFFDLHSSAVLLDNQRSRYELASEGKIHLPRTRHHSPYSPCQKERSSHLPRHAFQRKLGSF